MDVGEEEEGGGGGRENKGLTYKMAGFFILAQLAGAGFLSLPSAVANTGYTPPHSVLSDWIKREAYLIGCKVCIDTTDVRILVR